MITRDQILLNAVSWPMYDVEYSQSDYYNGHRADCSGYVSMCWGLDRSYNTVDILEVCHEISFDELRPGDAVGKCGPGTAGDYGHIQLFEGWHTFPRYSVLEQTPDYGPQRNEYVGSGPYNAYRFNYVDEKPAPPPTPPIEEDDEMKPLFTAQDAHSIVYAWLDPARGICIANVGDSCWVNNLSGVPHFFVADVSKLGHVL